MKPGDLVFSDKPTWSRRRQRQRTFDRAGIVYSWPEKDGLPYLVIDDFCPDVIRFVSEVAHSDREGNLLAWRWLRCMGPDGVVAVYDANSMRGGNETG
jgi:hypothetical protein